MDDLTLLRKVRDNVAAPLDSLDKSRVRLATAMARETDAKESRSTYRARWASGISVAAAAAIAVTLVVSNVTGTTGGSASASAVEVLNNAADLSPTAIDFDLKPGQFLRISTTTKALFRVGPLGVGDASGQDTSGWIEQSEDVLYVPADRSGDWVWVRDTTPESRGGTAAEFFGTGAEQARTNWFADSAPDSADATWVLPGGAVTGADGDSTDYNLGPSAEAETMPRDGGQLLAWYREQKGFDSSDSSADFSIFDTISEDLRWNLVPADLREAMFRALALMPGVSLIDSTSASTSIATLAIDSDGHRNKLTIDTKTGVVTSTAQIDPLLNRDGSSIYPKGTPTSTSTISTTIVDSAS